MEIVLKNTKSEYLEIFSLLDLDNIHETFKRFSSIKEPLEAKIFTVSESISSHQLAKLKTHLNKINVSSLRIYSNNRNTVLSGKSLKIDSVFTIVKFKKERRYSSHRNSTIR
jgi:septum site-determining protein MinC